VDAKKQPLDAALDPLPTLRSWLSGAPWWRPVQHVDRGRGFDADRRQANWSILSGW